jgi:signal transduction histidine kinase
MKGTRAPGGASINEQIVDELPSAVLVVDSRGAIVRANERARQVLRRDDGALTACTIDDVIAPLEELRERAHSAGDDEARARATLPDGDTTALGYAVQRIQTGTGDTQHIVVFRDLSADDELREDRDRLLQMAALSEMLPTVLHDLKNPLAGVTTAVEVLLEELPAGDVQAQLHAVLWELRRMRLALDGVGCTNRPLHIPRYSAVDMACRDAFLALSAVARSKGILARCDVDDMPLLPMDPSVVRALVFNLMTNAIAACQRGDTIQLHARLRSAGHALEISVVDTGRGMTAREHARCTELFYSTRPHGSGIGLTQCRRAVEEARGTLDIQSVIGIGTNVIVSVPTVTPTQHPRTNRGGDYDVENR